MHLASRPTIPEYETPTLRLRPFPMGAERIRQRARHPVQAVPVADIDEQAERDEREQQAVADGVEGIVP